MLSVKADDSKKLTSKKSRRPYYLIAFRDEQAAKAATMSLDPNAFRDYAPREALNGGRADGAPPVTVFSMIFPYVGIEAQKKIKKKKN